MLKGGLIVKTATLVGQRNVLPRYINARASAGGRGNVPLKNL